MAYGLQVENKQFTIFNNPIKHQYGVRNNTNEIDLSKIGLIAKNERITRKMFTGVLPPYNNGNADVTKITTGIPEDLYVRLNNNLSVYCPENWDNNNGDLNIYITGDIIHIGAITQAKSNYGIKVEDKYITTKDAVLRNTSTIQITAGYLKNTGAEIVNLHELCANLIKVISDLNMDFSFQLRPNSGSLLFTTDYHSIDGVKFTVKSYSAIQ
ncbi:hypothetical protein A4G16_02185 [Mannheimia granulomatis]|uniref:Uncharacterized protein n=1 Tax=Mannheimia granulomatis TaxID=85402 RepID=A0A6G8JGG1_9PAST|nr:hypothetical protein [Mannheimia granulomatis]QIM66265.1 hypothetical protein A4G16_02185 [Mannheimia granulomatis]